MARNHFTSHCHRDRPGSSEALIVTGLVEAPAGNVRSGVVPAPGPDPVGGALRR